MATTLTRCNHFLLAILCAAIFNPIRTYAERKDQKLLFIIGDSLFDPGNNQYTTAVHFPTTSFPYGMTLNNHSTGRFSDGLIVPDFIALHANLSILRPFMKPGVKFSGGANFASGGAGVLDQYNGPIDFRTQTIDLKKVISSMVKEVGEAEAKKRVMKSVLLFSLGGNDYFSYNSKYPNATGAQKIQHVNAVIAKLTSGIKDLYNIGLRKIAIQNVGPLGCYPGTRSEHPELVNGACVPSLQAYAAQHNKALAEAMKKLETQLPGFKYSIFDYFHALSARIHNPTRYGFKVGLSACCGSGLYNGAGRCGGDQNYSLCSNPNEYVLFDGGHHTQRTNKQLAELLWNGIPKMTGPYNMKQLFQFA
ncbi:GDSL esterase/lipase 1-like [Euphorbia lathyris]|uniref:GDSL esterase/lipase 1-like n=1 Tax=Euphorbia lathyris TaxID=212925 RepID=UPI00331316F1